MIHCGKGANACIRPSVYSPAHAILGAAYSNGFAMKDDKDKREGRAAKNPRQDRLKLALRENLKRRKSQARGRSDSAGAPSNGDNASPHDESGQKRGE
jgi:hypothetical protein